MTLETTHAESDQAVEAWSRVLGQFRGAARLKALSDSIYAPISDFGRVMEQVRTARGVDTAFGKQLDGVGDIVRQPRELAKSTFIPFFGFKSQPAGRGFGKARIRRRGEAFAASTVPDDAEYRMLIKNKIALNNGHGTREEIIAAALAMYKVPSVRVRNAGNAKLVIWLGAIPRTSSGTYDAYIYGKPEDILPVAAGVGVSIAYYDRSRTFGFKSQGFMGFGKGAMARYAASSIAKV